MAIGFIGCDSMARVNSRRTEDCRNVGEDGPKFAERGEGSTDSAEQTRSRDNPAFPEPMMMFAARLFA